MIYKNEKGELVIAQNKPGFEATPFAGILGFDLNAAVGPQADFREAEAQRGFAQGLGMIVRSLAFGPIGVLSDIALSHF